MNPLFRNKKNLIIYLSVWLVIAITHFLFLHYKLHLDINICIFDSLFHNIPFCIIGAFVWYLVKYNQFTQGKIASTIITHIVGATLLIVVWVSLGKYMTPQFISKKEEVLIFLDQAYLFRFIIGYLIYIALVLSYYIILYNDNIKEKIKNEYRLLDLLKESELNNLKTQVNPHFLFNSLNSISSLTLIAPDKAHDMIIKLSDFLRYSLKNSKKQTTTIAEELNICDLYISIEKIRFGAKLNYISKIDKTLLNSEIPSIMLQPLLENAIKHGVSKNTKKTDVILKIVSNNNNIHIKLVNSYDEKWEKTNKGTNTGLNNISQRLHHIYNKRNLMQTVSKDGLFTVEINIPHQKQNNK